jgi:hypothetical protein
VLVLVLTEGASLVPMTKIFVNNVNLLSFLLLENVLARRANIYISLPLRIHAKIVIHFASHALAHRKMNVWNATHNKTVRSIRQQGRVTVSYLFMRRTMNQCA